MEKSKKTAKEVGDEITQALVENLNKNVKAQHIQDVEAGLVDPDNDYYRFKEENKLATFLSNVTEENNMRNKPIMLIVILLVTIVASVYFYWFQWMPGEIRKTCSKGIHKIAEEIDYAYANNKYRDCLTQRGLRPESIYVNTEE